MRSRRVASGIVTVVFACGIVACGEDEPLASGRGMRAERGAAEEAEHVPSADPGAFERPRTVREPDEAPPPPPSRPPSPPATPTPPRDLAAELAAAVGDPSACLAEMPDSVRSATVRVDAIVHPDGALSSVRASVSPADAAAIACVQRMASRARLRGEVPDAPRSVQSSVDVVR